MKIIISIILIYCAIFTTINNANQDAKISGGKPAVKGQFPWHAIIFVDKIYPGHEEVSHTVCGGALIAKDVILTSGGCLYSPNVFNHAVNVTKIVLGSVNVNPGGENDGDRYETKAVSYVLCDNYDPYSYIGDLGLVFIENGVVFNDYIKAIDISPDVVKASANLTFSGFGNENGTGMTDHLYYREGLISFSQEECKNMSNPAIYDDDTLCTTSGVTTTGDGGGPLVANFTDNPVYVGTPKYLNGLDKNVAHTRVSSYYNWIKNAIAEYRKKDK